MTSPSPAPMLFDEVTFTPEECAIFARREDLKPSQWADRHISLPWGDYPGPWRTSLTPYLRQPLDTLALPWVRRQVNVAPPQVGKTIISIIFLAWATDHAPGPALMIMGDMNMASRMSERRVQPLINASERWAAFKSPNPDHFGKRSIVFSHGMHLEFSWASSPNLLASIGYRYVVASEVEKYKAWAGDSAEADPVALFTERANTYPHTHKIILESTPNAFPPSPEQSQRSKSKTKGLIWRELLACQVIHDYQARCPLCGHHQVMRLGQLRWDPSLDQDPERIEAEALAWYECEACQAPWHEMERRQAVDAGRWAAHLGRDWTPPPREVLSEPWQRPEASGPLPKRPVSVGFHFSAFVSLFIPLGRLGAKAAKAASGDKEAEKALATQYLAEPWADQKTERREDAILALVNQHHPRDRVPPDTACLVLTADTQKHGFWYEVRAWLYGQERTSQQVAFGYVESFAALHRLVTGTYPDAEGNAHRVRFGLIDAMGDKTADVYDWCRLPEIRGIIYPSQGAPGRQNLLWKATTLEYYPGSDKRIPGGIKLYRLDTHALKDALAGKLTVAPTDPGAWLLHHQGQDNEWRGPLADLARHYCAETKDDRGLWQNPQEKANHLWDCAVLQLASAYILDVGRWRRPDDQPQLSPPAPAAPAPEAGHRPNWFANRRR